MGKNLLKILGTGLLAGAFTIGGINPVSSYSSEKFIDYNELKEKMWDKAVDEQTVVNPFVPNYCIPSSHCSRYARLSTQELFDKNYRGADAWDLQYKNSVIGHFDSFKEVKDLIAEGTLKPGMLIGAKHPVKNIKTYGDNGFDARGKLIEYTHVVAYYGLDKNETPIFLHQWGRKKEIRTQEQLKEEYGLEFVEIINDREK